MESFKEIMELIKKTNDRCIVLDSANNSAYVILPFKEYENIVKGQVNISKLTEEELLSKINHDIAIWKANQPEEDFEWESSDFLSKESENIDLKEDFFEEEEEKYYFEPIE